VRRLGFEYSYAKEKEGALVHNIFPTQSGATTQSNESWKVDLSLHTENAFHPLRPDFVVLYCVRTPEAPPATHLSVLQDILPRLTDEEIQVLREPRFTIKVVDSFLTGGEKSARLPLSILDGCARNPVVRWHENIRGVDKSAEAAAAAFSAAAKASSQAVRLQPGDLLAFGNETCLHGRDKFDASLDGADRWLLRSYVRRDLSQLKPFVLASQPRTIRMDLNARAVA
jgi:alpha-ketoglutarate-dependent taurine dioxygenase